MGFPVRRAAPLLFVSGVCALVYQIAWFRELRLVFGASTAASAAVLAVFMGGLGAGGLVLGRKSDRWKNAWLAYGNLEILISVCAAITPLLVYVSRTAYLASGGSFALGDAGATALRLLFTVLVIGAPTFLMGGTLPAAAKAVGRAEDAGRSDVAILYAVNTCGAVVGTLATTFLLLEVFGTQVTLRMACLVNALVGLVARMMSRGLEDTPAAAAGENAAPATEVGATEVGATPAAAPWAAPAFAFVAGFAFFLLELCWYRMLAPLLGGSSYTFGLILGVALVGIGAGSLAYAVGPGRRAATIQGFAIVSAAEAVCVLVPYALGDRIATLALLLRPLSVLGFSSNVVAWTVISAIVVLPAAFVAGVQFPLLIGLYGKGEARVGRHVGAAYLANTIGAILGSLAGGFGFLHLFTAPGCWRLVGWILAGTAVLALAFATRGAHERRLTVVGAILVALALWLSRAAGPTHAWRTAAIGAGREDYRLQGATVNTLRARANNDRASVVWAEDGRESHIALVATDEGYTFKVNGKADGAARGDAATQVMSGLMGAALHERPERSMVIGLGTGSTAGWLAEIPSMTRVDVVELEPSILRVARDCAAVNNDVLSNPKVHVFLGDAREVLLTTRARYDVIFSEPSNPYRAGISSLYTQEYYQGVRSLLTQRGLFLQWVQGYEVDGTALRLVLGTLRTVFQSVMVWRTAPGDLLFIASEQPVAMNASVLRGRLHEEPYRRGMRGAWSAEGLEAFLAHFIGDDRVARHALETIRQPNTDDQNLLEFAFARTVGQRPVIEDAGIDDFAAAVGAQRPAIQGDVDWARVREHRLIMAASGPSLEPMPTAFSAAESTYIAALTAFAQRNAHGAAEEWKKLRREPKGLFETMLVARDLAANGDPAAAPLVARLTAQDPATGALYRGHLAFGQRKYDEGSAAVLEALTSAKASAWVPRLAMHDLLDTLPMVARANPATGRRVFEELGHPFPAGMAEAHRRAARVDIAMSLPDAEPCPEAFAVYEPNPPWDERMLEARSQCYAATLHPLAASSLEDLRVFHGHVAAPFGPFGLAAPPPQPRAPPVEVDAGAGARERGGGPSGHDASAHDAAARDASTHDAATRDVAAARDAAATTRP